MKYLLARSGVLVPAAHATWRCAKNAPAVITPSKVLTANGEPWRRERGGRRVITAPPSDRRGLIGTMAPPLLRAGPPAGGGGGGGSIGTITNAVLSRDVFHAGGGQVITVTGLTAVSGTPTITINGTACTAVTAIGSTSLSFVTPALAGITLPQYVTLVMDGKTFANFNYLGANFGVFGHPTTFNLEVSKAPGTTLGRTGFENNAILSADGQLNQDSNPTGGGSLAVVGSGVIAPHSGSFCLQQTSATSSATGDVAYAGKWAQTDITSGTGGLGRWHRWYTLIPAASLTATAHNGQIKQFLSRDGVDNFIVAGIGPEFRDAAQDGINVWAVNNDAGNWHMNDNSSFSGSYGVEPTVVADVWHELMCWEWRDTVANIGHAKFYYDGKKIADSLFQNPSSNAALANMGNNTANVRDARFGFVYSQNALSYPLLQYLDDIIVGDWAPNTQDLG